MPEELAFQCNNCHEVFHNDGLQLIIHGQAIGQLCSSCLVNTKSFHLLVQRESVRKPYMLACFIPLETTDKESE